MIKITKRIRAAGVCMVLIAASVRVDAAEPLGIAMENYEYPYPVHFFPLQLQGQDLRMAYMDVGSSATGAQPLGTVVLLHGKNFFGAYWKNTIAELSAAGYRVVVPDQLGFGKSSKTDINYSFHLLAKNTRDLLTSAGVQHAVLVGHS